MIDAFTIFAWLVLALLFLAVVVAIVWLGSLPKKIAIQRGHPQVDAINACSWIGLALAGVGWPIAFVWAFLKSGPIGSQFGRVDRGDVTEIREEIDKLRLRLIALEDANTARQTEDNS